jgi:hypothetical protein
MINTLKKLRDEDHFAYVSLCEVFGQKDAKKMLVDITGKDIAVFYETSTKDLSMLIFKAIESKRASLGVEKVGGKTITRLASACGVTSTGVSDNVDIEEAQNDTIEEATKNREPEHIGIVLALSIAKKMYGGDYDSFLERLSQIKDDDSPEDVIILDTLTRELEEQIGADEYKRFINSVSILYPEYEFS